MTGATPDSLLALHDAGYREVVERLGAGARPRRRLRRRRRDRPPRRPRPLRHRRRLRRATRPGSQRRSGPRTGRPDCASRAWTARASGCAASSVDWACSSHIIEHFTAPERHVAELARVLADDGTAFVITPEPAGRLREPVPRVPVRGRRARVAARACSSTTSRSSGSRATRCSRPTSRPVARSGERILKLDFLDLRHRIPRRWYVWTYERALPVVYTLLGSEELRRRLGHRPHAPLPHARHHAPRRRCCSRSPGRRAARDGHLRPVHAVADTATQRPPEGRHRLRRHRGRVPRSLSRGLLRSQGPPMEEGFMLVFPERLLAGDFPNRDFLHLYGPGSVWILAGLLQGARRVAHRRAALRAPAAGRRGRRRLPPRPPLGPHDRAQLRARSRS